VRHRLDARGIEAQTLEKRRGNPLRARGRKVEEVMT